MMIGKLRHSNKKNLTIGLHDKDRRMNSAKEF